MKDDLRYFYRLREKDLVREGVGIVEGHTLVRRLAASKLVPLSVLCVEGQEAEYTGLFDGNCPVHALTHDEIQELIGFKFHRGVMAAVERPPFRDIGELLKREPEKLVLSCEQIQEGSNLGAIIRSARAFDVRAVILGTGSADPFSRKSIRASAGWVFSTNFYRSGDSASLFEPLSDRGYTLLAAESRARGAIPLETYCDARPRGPEVLFLGHEFDGLDEDRIRRMDHLIEIPMEGGIDSLNVGVAAGIFLYRLSRKD